MHMCSAKMGQLCHCLSAPLSNIFLVLHHLHPIVLRPLVLYLPHQHNRTLYTRTKSTVNQESRLFLLALATLSEATRAPAAAPALIVPILTTNQILRCPLLLTLPPALPASIKENSRPCPRMGTLSPIRQMKASPCQQRRKRLGWPIVQRIRRSMTIHGPMAISYHFQHHSPSARLAALLLVVDLGLLLSVPV